MDDPDAEVSAVFGGRSVVPPLVVQASGVSAQTTASDCTHAVGDLELWWLTSGNLRTTP